MNISTFVCCCNPECGIFKIIPIEQKREIFTDNLIEYGRISLIYCSKKCADTHQIKLAESNFFEIGNLEEYDSGIWVKEFDIRKRGKRKGEPILRNTDVEIRAKALKKKLIMLKKTGKKYMLSTEVSRFLTKELPRELKVTHKNTRIYSRRVMKKLIDLFPNEFRIGKNGKNLLYIEFIE